jgi:hypothetical protein
MFIEIIECSIAAFDFTCKDSATGRNKKKIHIDKSCTNGKTARKIKPWHLIKRFFS